MSFQSERKFYADQYFPYGLARSGEFSSEQVILLECHGWAYLFLSSGKQLPIGDEEQDFVEVCKGTKEPVTAHEKAWLRFHEKTSNSNTSSVGICFYDNDAARNIGSSDEEW